MEAVEELPIQPVTDDVKANIVTEEVPVASVEANLCHKTNGVVETTAQLESADATCSESGVLSSDAEIVRDTGSQPESHVLSDSIVVEPSTVAESVTSAPEEELLAVMETNAAVEHILGNNNTSEEITEEIIESSVGVVCHETEVTLENTTVKMDTDNQLLDKVTFETEILVEKNDNESSEAAADTFDNSNILSELGQSMELSEVLRSADTTENIENNNSTAGEEVFNKEELLDILEGNDVAPSSHQITELLQTGDPNTKKMLEAQIAMKQLTRLKTLKVKPSRKKYSLETKKSGDRTPRKKKTAKSVENNEMETENAKENLEENSNTTEEIVGTEEKSNNSEVDKSESIVNVLVQDWDDDEPSEMEQDSPLKETDTLVKTPDQSVKIEETASGQEAEAIATKSTDSTYESQANCKSGDEGQPHRRLGRVIKKKVIFDPDNPDTFTKVKVITKSKEPQLDKEQPPPKKIKSDQTPQRAKSKSPISKSQWKKPPPKNGNSKQNKRLTEIDKLLMDEGAVNMIYQLTPEAPKGKKNMKTKAEFIKKLQSSTPDSKEMKFRERKKETKSEEGEAKKILVGKQRSSLSSTVMSPSVCDDSFETHSADDSIIYRRHSSSSYSSSCMSPRRLSDVDVGAMQTAARASRQASTNLNQSSDTPANQPADVFMGEVNEKNHEEISKNNCLSIKEKLSKKISMAFNKRKRDTSKTEKPTKQKKLAKEEKDNVKIEPFSSFKYVTVNFDQRLAEICIGKTGSSQSVEMLKELKQVLENVDNIKDISVTLLTSENGVLCSDLDFRPLLDENIERRTNYAYEISESVRSLLSIVERHSKLVITGVWGACSGVALALVALSDVAVASQCSTFAVDTPPAPGVAALSASSRRLPQSLVKDLVVFGRRLSAQEAVQSGLVDRTVWPARGGEQVRESARDIAAQPIQSILLKKQLLCLKKSSESESIFQLSLEKERDLLVEYWTSVEGQDILRANLRAA